MTGKIGSSGRGVCSQTGVSLIEVLVALVVLSIGLVGIAALNLYGVRAVHSSMQSSIASVVALEAEEWLWEALGDNRLSNCADLTTVIGLVDSHWFPTTPAGDRLTLPNGAISADRCDRTVVGLDCVLQARLTVRWDEGRFETLATNPDREEFIYWVQTPCRI